MPKLSLIQSEAMRLVGRLPEARWRAQQRALIELCEAHWAEMRGPEPAVPLAHALWTAAPPRADLLADLVAAGDGRLEDLLGGKTARGFALLALAEIERGDEEGIRLAHAPMMLFDSPAAGERYAEAVAAALRRAAPAPPHTHAGKPPLWNALACIAAHTGRTDLAAALRVIGVLAAHRAPGDTPDAQLDALRTCVSGTGVAFSGVDDGHVRFAVHGEEHPPVRTRQLGEMLGEIRGVLH